MARSCSSNLIRCAGLLDRLSKVECPIWNFRLEEPYCNFPLVKAHANGLNESNLVAIDVRPRVHFAI
jgi:hypothetical protein